ncbi:FHA domain-containing protein [Trichocoleus sp. FACHB-591]|uniref:FHA domain-containing protein n=1 Tax=Trichocoleus sp. FACHB-591 TaxID=2692872 RepID=UPI0016872877|nr:FHA domain-containing protein [Trichocoleus sp. FACHB-591]MBD2098906.1 FHA domain-containing protein [Trichocoleus sp. FACHB-591]
MAPEPIQNHLLIIEDGKGRRKFVLGKSLYSIGRDVGCDIRLSSLFVGRHHANLIQKSHEDGSYYYRIVDGDFDGKPSVNGLLINGHKLQGHDLKNEDVVVFGPCVRVIYFILEDSTINTFDPDTWDIPEFDITLIDPKMVGVAPED